MATDDEGAVHPGTTGGMGGSSEEGERDDEAARAFIERSTRDASSDTVTVHDADVGADLGADEAGSDAPDRA